MDANYALSVRTVRKLQARLDALLVADLPVLADALLGDIATLATVPEARAIAGLLALLPEVRAPLRRCRGAGGLAQRRGWEKRREAHERATAEIEARAPEFVALWNETHQLYKGSFEARAEAFIEHAYAHGGEVVEAQDRSADETLAGWLATHDGRAA